MIPKGVFPSSRMRRMRRDDFSRRLMREHTLTADDLKAIENVYGAFYQYGPAIQYSSTEGGASYQPTYVDLMLATDPRGRPRGYLSSEDAFATARALAEKEGLFAGISSGANVLASLQIATELGPGQKVVTVLVDSGLKYLQGDLFA
mgnify:CR=1 FL=1